MATLGDVTNLLGTIEVIVPVEVHYQWRPQLTDAGDEIVLEAAVNGRADAIVSFNHRDYKGAPGRFGIRTAESYFTARRGRGDLDKALAFLSRPGGELPRPEDQLPD